MRYSINSLLLAMVVAACGPALAQTPTYKVGRTPSEEEIRAWDTAVGTDGKELPPGSGTAKEGATIYAQKCATCHGPNGEGAPEAKKTGAMSSTWLSKKANGKAMAEAPNYRMYPLVGGQGTLATIHPVRTIGSFYAFPTTIWDYIRRGMPINDPGSLSPDETYALTAYLLYQNGIIKESDVIDAKNLPKIQMPNRNGFDPKDPETYKYKPGPPRPFGQYP